MSDSDHFENHLGTSCHCFDIGFQRVDQIGHFMRSDASQQKLLEHVLTCRREDGSDLWVPSRWTILIFHISLEILMQSVPNASFEVRDSVT